MMKLIHTPGCGALVGLVALLGNHGLVTAQENEPVIWPYANTRLKPDLNTERQVQKLLSAMTVEQKVAQIVQPEIRYLTLDQMRKYGFGSYLNGGNSAPYNDKRASAETWLEYADQMYEASVDDTLDGSAIPTIWGTDAMHGHSNVYGATLFPHNIGLGAARDPELIERIGEITAKEVAATGIEWVFAPTVAVARDDRWGRSYESYSEHPQLVESYAGHMVEGLQGKIGESFLTDYHRIATAKHFIGDGGTSGGEDRGDTQLSEQALRDLHAAGYTTAIRDGVLSVMASFNSWNGERLHGHKYLLTEVLKGLMGFEGFVVGDWNGHKFVDGCDLTQCAAAINAGVDVIMVPEHYEAFFHNTVKQVNEGVISMARLDDAVTRFLRAKVRWGLLERGKPSQRAEASLIKAFNSQEHKEVAREAVRKSLVLLKNNNHLLPLSASQKVLVAGDGAHNVAKQAGGWSVSWQGSDNTNADFPHATSIYQGIAQHLKSLGGEALLSEDGSYTSKPDVAIVVIGEEPYAEWYGDRQSLDYQAGSKRDLALLRKLRHDGIPVVTVFLSGRPLWLNQEINQSDAFVAAWLPGSEGQGVADLLFRGAKGEVRYDFTGKLSFSWPNRPDQYALNPEQPDYEPLFPYGYGLSYDDHHALAQLAESSGASKSEAREADRALFVRNLSEGLCWVLSDGSGEPVCSRNASLTSQDGKALSMEPVNLAYQEDGRRLTWQQGAKAQLALRLDVAESLKELVAKGPRVHLTIRLESELTPSSKLNLFCSPLGECLVSKPLASLLDEKQPGVWQEVEFHLDELPDAISFGEVSELLQISATGPLALAIANISLAYH